MPFTKDDALKYKKGLLEKGQKQWARIANSALKACMKKGGDEKTCAASAIKQANGVVNANVRTAEYSSYQSKQALSYDTKLTVHQEKAHLVVPVVMMVEGVHDGSLGPLLHTINELGKFPASWNGIPVIIYHPQRDGEFVSANQPDIIDNEVVGRVYNTDVEGKKLKAEIWIDEDRLNTISPIVLEAINEGKEMEVSVGVFNEFDETPGVWNNERYDKIAVNHRPDHLAILPDEVGACSLEDGCGLGANKKEEDMKITNELLNQVRQVGYTINEIGNNAEKGYKEKMEAVYAALREKETNEVYCYLEEMYDDSIVYSESGKGASKMYKQSYKIESGKIEFVGEPIEVRREVEYVVNAIQRTKFNNNQKKEDNMSKNECPKCVEKVNALIANTKSGFTKDDREWLETLPEAALDKVTPRVIEVEKIVEKTVEVNKFSPEDQADLAWAKKQRQEKRATMSKSIQTNTSKELWPDEILNAMSEDHLERIFNSTKKEEDVDYSLNGNQSLGVNTSDEEPLYPVGVVIGIKK